MPFPLSIDAKRFSVARGSVIVAPLMDNATTRNASDIPADSWIDRRVPVFARPFLRLIRADRPIGTWLLLIPCVWSTALAATAWPDPWLLSLFAVGAFIMRGAGCTINDLVDRDIDRRVARTATRPIASGDVSVAAAVLFLGILLVTGLIVLLQLNSFTVLLGLSSVGLIVIYPFMKRITYWPQIVLGLVFNWGALVGWAAVRGTIEAPAALLYLGCIFWTIGYDTVYAHQDKADDLVVGVKSTALKLGAATGRWLWFFYGMTLALLLGAGHAAQLSWPFFALLGVGGGHFYWQIHTLDINDPANCLTRFKSNRDFGFIVFIAIVAGKIIA